MRKIIYWATILLAGFALAGCQSKKTASTNTPKTVIKSEQLTQAQRQKQFNAICDQAMKPINAASYGANQSELVADAKAGKQKLADIRLILQNNTAQPEANQRLLAYIDNANQVLDAMIQNNNATYQQATKAFSDQTTAIARQDYNGRPTSMVNFAKRQQADTQK